MIMVGRNRNQCKNENYRSFELLLGTGGLPLIMEMVLSKDNPAYLIFSEKPWQGLLAQHWELRKYPDVKFL